MTGSGIFAATGENDSLESENANATPGNKTGLRMYQVHITGFCFLMNYECMVF